MRGSAFELGLQVRMAPASGGGLYVSIPDAGGTFLTRLDASGREAEGWPIFLAGSEFCGLLLAAADGSVRIVCQVPGDQVTEGPIPERAYAFAANGRPFEGWPVTGLAGYGFTGRMIGSDLVIYFEQLLGSDAPPGEQIPGNAWITTISADGIPSNGTQVPTQAPIGPLCCPRIQAIGPDGVAYGVLYEFGEEPASPKTSSLTALGTTGVVGGFPVAIAGLASTPAFDAAGRIHMTVESEVGGPARVLVFDAAGHSLSGGSGFLGLEASADCVGIEGTCEVPAPPLVGPDATRYVVSSGLQSTVVAGISPTGQLMDGWPYETGSGHQPRGVCPAGAVCEGYALTAPAIGPGSVLYLLHSAASASTGGRIVAVGPNGTVRPGWPVTLSRSGSGFWTVVVGADGTAYAMAVEPESEFAASATILALAPDGSKRYATTIIDP